MSETHPAQRPKPGPIANWFSPPGILHRSNGPLTEELLLRPGQFGLGMTHDSLRPDTTTTSVCGYCSTGCGLRVHMRDEQAIGLTPETEYPVNLGMACPKGWEALNVMQSADRAKYPLVRGPSGQRYRVSWNEAIRIFCGRFKGIAEKHGPAANAFLSTGQITCEEMALLGALTKFGMGMIHGDGNTRQCMATAVTAYKESLGFDAPGYCYDDFQQSDLLMFIGANPCIGHPILWQHVLANQNNPDLIVVDPRRTETAGFATQHLAIRPKSDLTLLYGLARILISEGWIDESFVQCHTQGFAEFAEFVAGFGLTRVENETGLQRAALMRCAEAIGHCKAGSFWWTMGVNQSYEGTRTAQAIINLALLTGNFGRPGTGANSITGQCNAMGSRLWSNTTSLFAGRRFEDPGDRVDIANILGIRPDQIPSQSSWSYDRIMEGIDRGEIRGLWVIATNTAHSWINQDEARRVLDKLEFLVVQDIFANTETAKQAHLILPAAGWGEKQGTFINSERRIGLTRKVAHAPGEALADFSIFRAIAHYWGCDEMLSEWDESESVFKIIQRLSRGRPCDITGIDGYAMLDRCGGVQWPWPEQDAAKGPPSQHRRLYEDGKFYTPDGRAKLLFEEPKSMPEAPNEQFPLVLLTGRGSVSQWHTQTRTSKSPVLRKLYPCKAFAELHPADAQRLGVVNGSEIEVASRRASVVVTAYLTTSVRPGQIFIPMHYEETNRLTLAHFDPYSKQPSYKDSAVSVRPLSKSVAHSLSS